MDKKILYVDLNKKTYEYHVIPKDITLLFVGGRGVGAYLALKEIPPRADPLSEENVLIFTCGILAGTQAPGFSKFIVITKSPLTNTYARSVCGGKFGAHMGFMNTSHIVIKGKSNTPVYLLIDDKDVHFLDATDLWGKDTFETQEILKTRHGPKVSISTIGPAGERGVLFSAIIHERRAAARLGVGAVMGSKNLKAIVLDPTGLGPPALYNKDNFTKIVKRHALSIKEHPRRIKLNELGTTFMTLQMHELGIFPVKNFQQGRLDGIENIGSSVFRQLKVKDYGCYGCTTKCGNVFKAEGQIYSGIESEGPEYETIYSFGGEICNTDANSIIFLDQLCDRLGIDTISMGVLSGFIIEIFEKGIVTKKELEGLEPKWGDPAFVVSLIERIISGRGIGALLSKGTKRVSEEIGRGASYYAMHVKGLELPGYEPRAAKAHGLGYAVSNIGGSHMYGYVRQEISGFKEPREVNRLSDEGKGDVVGWNQIRKAIEEAGILCNFADSNMDQRFISDLYYEATGIREFGDLNHLWEAGKRIVISERLFNVREGFKRSDDFLPQRFLREPLLDAGPSTGEVYRNFEGLLQEYYEYMGLDKEGKPEDKVLRKLKLTDALGL